ncbi:hypothetical protein BT63DRAFT_448491 [Microthyrium microscopicum]|uniref:Chloride channel protein n=1 Tax=Microthyrium microscopicum TaxID=703497 RepID=A0A6A6TXF6_9PEZI|nr:hypothetical protein BT63DRAFT_448491 [Microthyrium microscopicum]
MASSTTEPNERSSLLGTAPFRNFRALSRLENGSHVSTSILSKEEEALGDTAAGEILPYSPYSSIDFLHDLIKDTYRRRYIKSLPGLQGLLTSRLDALSGWLAVALIGLLTGFVAYIIDVSEATISDFKFGYCSSNYLLSKELCCRINGQAHEQCPYYRSWDGPYEVTFGIYLAVACTAAVISSGITMMSKTELPHAMDWTETSASSTDTQAKMPDAVRDHKVMYMVSGAGIPEIKTILSGFVIPGFLGLKVLLLKIVGAIFAVASGLPLGKEAPMIHIGTCIANLVGERFAKYRTNGRQMRELLTAGSAAGISAAFGAPIGGVLFAYEELSVYFPRKALYRTFLCSITAAIALRLLDPFGTGRLVLFETQYGSSYTTLHYLLFIFLGIAGGIWGGTFTRMNFLWARWFRSFSIIKEYPVFEVFLVTAAVACLQFPDPATRAPYVGIIRGLLVDCKNAKTEEVSWVCLNEGSEKRTSYVLWLIYGTIQVLGTTTITAGIKVPSGIIMPALAGGALFGRLVGQVLPVTSSEYISPGIFAMVAAGAFLAGVTRMTISLCVVMFELTGELEYVLPHMVAILCAKWVADAISKESIYDLNQTALGHPFLSPDEAIAKVAEGDADTAYALVPPKNTMAELTVVVPITNKVPRKVLEDKLMILKRRGLMDSGLVLVQGRDIVQGYIAQTELEYGLSEVGAAYPADVGVRLLGSPTEDEELDLTRFVNRAPVCVCVAAPIEEIVAIFTQLGVRYICLTEEGTGSLIGVVIRKRLMGYLDSLHHH